MTAPLFVAGFQKCGTDTLFGVLASQPGFCASLPKETHFHAMAEAFRDDASYAAAFAAADGTRLEGSASTAVVERAAASIHAETGGHARFVFIVRPHAERVWSAFLHMCKAHPPYEQRTFDEAVAWSQPDLPAALDHEKQGIARAALEGRIDLASFATFGADADWNYRYLANTCYAQHIARFVALFGRDAVKVVALADLSRRPADMVDEICRFAGMPSIPIRLDPSARRNTTLIPTGGPLGRLLADRRLRALARSLLPSAARSRAKSLLEGVALRRPDRMPAQAEAALERLFAEDRKALTQLLGRDPLATC